MNSTEKKSVMGRLVKAVRTNSLIRKKSEKMNVSTKRVDSGMTTMSKRRSTSQKNEEKIDVGKDCAFFKDASKATESENRVQGQDKTKTQSNHEIAGDAETEYFDPDIETAKAATEFANNVIHEAFSRYPTLAVENVANVTTVTEITKSVERKPNAQTSKPPVEVQTEKVQTQVHVETKTDVKDFTETRVVKTTVEKSGSENAPVTMSKKEDKIVLRPVRAQWELKLTPKNRYDHTKQPISFRINLHHKGELLPGNLPAGISGQSGGSSRPPPNLEPGRRY